MRRWIYPFAAAVAVVAVSLLALPALDAADSNPAAVLVDQVRDPEWQWLVSRAVETGELPFRSAPAGIVVGTRDRREIANAKANRGADDVLLAVLYARAGLRADARNALRRGAAKGDAAARMLLDRNFANAAKNTR